MGTPVTITATTTSVDVPVTTLITTTEQFTDTASGYTSVFAKQVEEENRRLSSVPQTGPRVKPFTTKENEWLKKIYNTVGKYAEESETLGMSQSDRMQENNDSPFAQPHGEKEVVHNSNMLHNNNILLYKTTREDNGVSPHPILPEEYNPLRTRIPNPISEATGVLPTMDGKTTAEMLVKISIMGLFAENPHMSIEHLLNHLHSFIFRSQAINDEFLNRVLTQKVIIPEEAQSAILLFRNVTSPNLHRLDEYLLGRINWRNFTPNQIRIPVQRMLIWVLELTQHEKRMGWSTSEWGELSAKDMSLFYHCLFFYPGVFALTCLILWKQMKREDMEAQLITGGLSNISPAAIMNFLRIYMLRLKEFRWMDGNLVKNIPHINKEELNYILANSTEGERMIVLNLYQKPGNLMPNIGNGRATPTRAYQKVLGNIFNEQVRYNPHIPVSHMARHPTTQVATSNPGTQGQPGLLQGQHMDSPHVTNTSISPHIPVPTIPIPSVPIPRATNTSTVNTLLGGPRMSLGVTTASPLQEKIGNMEYEYNSNSFISSSLSNPSNGSNNS